jgi:hypothetical protein
MGSAQEASGPKFRLRWQIKHQDDDDHEEHGIWHLLGLAALSENTDNFDAMFLQGMSLPQLGKEWPGRLVAPCCFVAFGLP